MTRNERRDEVREILALDTDELVKRSNGQLDLEVDHCQSS